MKIAIYWINAKSHNLNFSLYIAKRYLFTKSKNNAINIITIIAAIGVFAGALALFIVLSGFAGLKEFSLSFTNEFDPDLKVLPATGKVFEISDKNQLKVQQIKGITASTNILEERVLLNFKNKNTPAYIKGVDENYQRVTDIDSSVIVGTWLHQDEAQVVIGGELSRKLSLGILDYSAVLNIMVPRPGKGQVTDPKKAFSSAKTIVTGLYSINEDLDSKYVFAPIKLTRGLLNRKAREFSSIEIKLAPNADEDDVTEDLKAVFGSKIIVKNRMQLNDKLYKMLNTENLAVYLIFTLVLIIALFNVGGAIVMSVLDKRSNIETLYNLGAQTKQIKRIFFLQGSLLTFTGGVIGLAVGFVIIYLQSQFNLVMITQTLPYPVLLKAENVVIVFATIMVLGITASYVGSTRVSKVLN